MASNNDRISKHSVGQSMAQMSFSEFSAAAALPPAPPHRGGGKETIQVPVSTKKKRGIDIDLNVALRTEEQDFSNSNENGCEIVEEEKSTVIAADPDEEIETRNGRWEALLDVAEIALREYAEENREKTESKSLTWKKPATRGVDELGSWSTRTRSTTSERNNCTLDEYTDDCGVVVRSTRGRVVAMPNKYRDSVLEPVAELPRTSRTGKSVALAAKRRKFRLSRDSK